MTFLLQLVILLCIYIYYMLINDLQVYNLNKENNPTIVDKNSFIIETCQRWLWITTSYQEQPPTNAHLHTNIQCFKGIEAYQFLLEVATGLRSLLIGEPDIFGQIKTAWKSFKSSSQLEIKYRLTNIMQNLFQDTKSIRTQYLQGLGGVSYASLTRKILRKYPPGPTLILGAGQLARSIIPLFETNQIMVWNRNKNRLNLLQKEITKKHNITFITLSDQQLSSALKKAQHLIICIPANSSDSKWIKLWKTGNTNIKTIRTVFHLGLNYRDKNPWDQTKHYYCLDDIYELEKLQNEIRALKINQALKACHDLATLRSLDGSIRTPHGWEYLSLFS